MPPSSFTVRLALAFSVLALGVGLLSSWVVYREARAQQLERLTAQLEAFATAAAVAIDGESFAALRSTVQQTGEDYAAIRARLDRLRAGHRDIRFVYTMRRLADGSISFVVDASEVDFDGNGRIDRWEEQADLGEPYPEAATMPALLRGFSEPTADREFTRDRWGKMLSGYAPILDGNGRSVGLVGVDMMADRVDRLRRSLLRGCAALGLTVALGSLMFALLLSWRLSGPLRALRADIDRARERGLTNRIEPRGCRELVEVSVAFNALLDERKRLEDRLGSAAKLEALSRISASLAHDVANNLTVIVGQTELALASSMDSAGTSARLRRIGMAATAATAGLRRLTMAARQEASELVPVDLHEIIEGMADLMRGKVGEALSIEARLAAPAAVVMGDPAELHDALLNLALNARDAAGPGGRLAFMTSATADGQGLGTLTLVVQDDGHGMTPEILERIFDPFFTTKPPGEGTGLGLFAVRRMAERHRAELRVHSRLGAGSSFTIAFPLVSAGAGETWAPSPGHG